MNKEYKNLMRDFAAFSPCGDEGSVSQIGEHTPAELARVIESLPLKYRTKLWKSIPSELKGEVLLEAHRELRIALIKKTDESELLESLSVLQMDELADIDADLPMPVVSAMVEAMDAQRKERYQLVANFADDSAGGLMDVDATAVRKDVSLKAVYRFLCQLRLKTGGLPEQLDHLVVIDRNNHVQGALYLSDLVSMNNSLTVKEVMKQDVPLILANQTAGEVVQIFEDHDLISAPVVDKQKRLLGRITVDDIIDVIRNESEENLLSQAGLSSDTDMFAPVIQTSTTRAYWLGTNLLTAFFAAWVIGLFESSIQQLVALAVLMPVVASMGGITGSQTLTVITRGLALNQVGKENILPLTMHELKVSMLNSALWATVVFLVAYLWYGDMKLGLVFGLALFSACLTGTFVGALIPIGLQRMGIDPAIAGSVVLTTVTDAIGFLVFLGAATLFLI